MPLLRQGAGISNTSVADNSPKGEKGSNMSKLDTLGKVTMDELNTLATKKVNSQFARNLVTSINRVYKDQRQRLKQAIITAYMFLQNWMKRSWPKVSDVMDEIVVGSRAVDIRDRRAVRAVSPLN